MRNLIHPTRYIEQMSSALTRIEAVARLPRSKRSVLLQREFDGLDEEDVLRHRAILGKLEAIMGDWKRDGALTYDAEFILATLAGQQVAPCVLEAADFGQSVIYVHFGPSAGLTLEADRACHIEGMYFHPTYRDGRTGLDLAFVCDEPAWKEFETLPYGQVLSAASRVAIGFVPFDGVNFSGAPTQWIDGEASLLADRVLRAARGVADVVLTLTAHMVPSTQLGASTSLVSVRKMH